MAVREVKKLLRLQSIRKAQLDAAASRLEITQSFLNELRERTHSFELARERASEAVNAAFARSNIDEARTALLANHGLPEAMQRNQELEAMGRKEVSRLLGHYQAARQNYEQAHTLTKKACEARELERVKAEQRDLDGRFLQRRLKRF